MREQKTCYAQVGIGGRARMYYEALCTEYADTSELVAFCDLSQTRMDYANRVIQDKLGKTPVPTYYYTDYDKMIREQRPDIVIVTSVDRTHDDYIVRAMELGCDVITEKPITTDARKAQRTGPTSSPWRRSMLRCRNCLRDSLGPLTKNRNGGKSNGVTTSNQIPF